MTISELRVLHVDITAKMRTLALAVAKGQALLGRVGRAISPDNITIGQINADQLVTDYLPLYNACLHDIEVAADALGTDSK